MHIGQRPGSGHLAVVLTQQSKDDVIIGIGARLITGVLFQSRSQSTAAR
jgi:hypothetical protein